MKISVIVKIYWKHKEASSAMQKRICFAVPQYEEMRWLAKFEAERNIYFLSASKPWPLEEYQSFKNVKAIQNPIHDWQLWNPILHFSLGRNYKPLKSNYKGLNMRNLFQWVFLDLKPINTCSAVAMPHGPTPGHTEATTTQGLVLARKRAPVGFWSALK